MVPEAGRALEAQRAAGLKKAPLKIGITFFCKTCDGKGI